VSKETQEIKLNKLPIKVTDKELIKFVSVLGVYKVKMLYADNKLNLTDKQINMLLQITE